MTSSAPTPALLAAAADAAVKGEKALHSACPRLPPVVCELHRRVHLRANSTSARAPRRQHGPCMQGRATTSPVSSSSTSSQIPVLRSAIGRAQSPSLHELCSDVFGDAMVSSLPALVHAPHMVRRADQDGEAICPAPRRQAAGDVEPATEEHSARPAG
eukprot:CAMPEP_0182875174 /NCGR_PEP_ID=MMETSP0034_2-20130328/13386_1 /TAXON_ID=156128 /ORGANISM="Nephroselmis pyriformis, Strain CCMP717" /LENGTH=157 /DNA_ID=CAMNT_0025007907 /DNA_START=7 /DNA_END=478 /DNA_ORIENTATION=-